jgi:hypothetical protein
MYQKKAFFALTVSIFSLLASACKPTLQPTSTATAAPPTPTGINIPPIKDSTATVPPPSTAQPTAGPKLCDNTYFPSDADTTWTYSGNNSKTGDYTRTDTILDSRDDGFTLGTKLPNNTYQVEFVCTPAGLIDMDPLKSTLTAMFAGVMGNVTVNTTGISGLTFPRDIQPANTWQHFINWQSASTSGTTAGQFIYQYTARGLEAIIVTWGSFDAMRIDVEIQVEYGSPQSLAGTYSESLWLVKDLGIVKSEGTSHIPGVEFTDTMQLTDFSSPP